MNHFENIKNVEDLKARYKLLAKELHPDKGGDQKEFQEMIDEYTSKLEELASVPFFLQDEYVSLGKALCGIAKTKKPDQYKKTVTGVKAVSDLLSLFGNKNMNDFKQFIDKLEL